MRSLTLIRRDGSVFEVRGLDNLLHLTDREEIDAALQKLSSTVELLHSVKSTLGSHANDLLPVSRLPPEILSVVFHFCVPGLDESPPQPGPWYSFSHVCREWRTVSISVPTIWSRIELHNPDMAGTLLGRSSTLPLCLRSSLGAEATDIQQGMFLDALSHVLPAAARIDYLDLDFPHQIAEQLFHDLVKQPAPRLRTLKLRSSITARGRLVASMPEGIFKGKDFSPQVVDLHSIILSWDSHWLRGVTHLILRNAGVSGWDSRESVFEALAAMPVLEELHLESSLGPVDRTISDREQPIHLSHLHSLYLNEGVEATILFLRNISVPSGAREEVWFNRNVIPDAQKTSALGKHIQFRGVPDSYPLTDLRIGGPDDKRLSVALDAGGSESALAPLIELQRACYGSDLPALLRCFPEPGWLDRIQRLSIKPDQHMSSATWLEIAKCLPLLDEICGIGNWAELLMEALVGDCMLKKSTAGPIFPALTRLQFIDLDITVLPAEEAGGMDKITDFLPRSLQVRRERGCNLSELLLDRCRGFDVGALRPFVDNIVSTE